MVIDFTLEEAKAFCAHMADKIIELEQMWYNGNIDI
jgi:hypothetical protein